METGLVRLSARMQILEAENRTLGVQDWVDGEAR